MVATINYVAIFEDPLAIACRFVIFELALVVVAVREHPFSPDELVLMPGSGISHGRLIENISSMAMLLPIEPLTRVHVFIGVGIESLTLLLPIYELS